MSKTIDLSKVDWAKLRQRINDDVQAATDSQLRRMVADFPRGSIRTMPAGHTTRPFIGDHITYGLRLQSWPGFRDEWTTPTVRAIAAGIVESGDWSRLAILADALQDAGCEDAALLGLMRLAGGLGLDMGGWWLMGRLVPASLQGNPSGYNYASGRIDASIPD